MGKKLVISLDQWKRQDEAQLPTAGWPRAMHGGGAPSRLSRVGGGRGTKMRRDLKVQSNHFLWVQVGLPSTHAVLSRITTGRVTGELVVRMLWCLMLREA